MSADVRGFYSVMETPNTAWSPYPHGADVRLRNILKYVSIGEHPTDVLAAKIIPQTTLDLLAAEQAWRDLDAEIAALCGGGCRQ